MGVGEPDPDLLDDDVQLVEGDGAGPLEAVDQRLALEQLEDQDDPMLGVLLHVEDLGHVVAVDRAGRLRLAPEPGHRRALRLGLGAQELHRDGPPGPDVLRSEHLSHTSPPKGPRDSVPVRYDGSRIDIQSLRSRTIIHRDARDGDISSSGRAAPHPIPVR
jgi:hypothetical protein